ncbi:ATP-binding protein [Geothermobacter hydrogeniphilus]|uniref:ATP-binding protein n=1 Tax=Geothermobacter hydrogeniphilus TaxID=1969733 RepID=A0A2K2HEG6_9BACT|nr:sce7725 family protein [Geothermobacter hydrogeniphilus]PNU21643.1 ATP-binding protein [Geothermobacter hydrogeniphilus]
MYYPYFRGKQYELITIRENAERMSQANIIPIIEPVKRSLTGLRRALEALMAQQTQFVLVMNPLHGELNGGAEELQAEIVEGLLADYDDCRLGFVVGSNTLLEDVQEFCQRQNKDVSIIHYGYPRAGELAGAVNGIVAIREHIFIDECCSRLYRRNFRNDYRVLVRDGFVKRTNREHPEVEHFSELHITYTEDGFGGFGDFLTVGDDFSESGGPAYAVAIHLTYIDSNEDDDMFIKHYISDRTTSPTDPGGKFLEALQKLVDDVEDPNSKILRSEAVNEFLELHARGHFPGLGYVKKLSMQHHIELIASLQGG